MTLLLERNQDLSVYYFISDLFSDVSFLHIVDDFPTTNLEIPTVAVYNTEIESRLYEMGNYERLKVRTWFIEVFAKNKAQRDDLTYRIFNALEDKLPVYDYNEGFPPTVVTQLGSLIPEELRVQVIKILPELVESLYFRATVIYVAHYDRL